MEPGQLPIQQVPLRMVLLFTRNKQVLMDRYWFRIMSMEFHQLITRSSCIFQNNHLSMFSRASLMRETTRLKRSAHQNPSTVNPGTILLANRTSNALITRRNNPKVMMVNGKVRITNKGFTNKLRIPITNATTSAVHKLTTCTPGKIYAAIIITNALTNQLNKRPIHHQYTPAI